MTDDWSPERAHEIIGHRAYRARLLLHVLRFRLEGPGAVFRASVCGSIARAFLVDSRMLDPVTHELDPDLAAAFRESYTNGWPDLIATETAGSTYGWCERCLTAYTRQRARADA